jgi:hypothetical protein
VFLTIGRFLLLEPITSNLGQMRNEHWMGEDYIVCPVRMIVSGVLDGSEGPLYYPPDEIANSVNAWNAIPIVVYHPEENGINVSARNPQVMEKYFVGWIFNAIYNPDTESLDGEAWLNKKRLMYCDEQLEAKYQILPRLKANQSIEVSTGLGTQNFPSTENLNKCPKTGKLFTHIARNYKPDHLAILPDREGACSVNDGCGIRVNENRIEMMDVTEYRIDSLLETNAMNKTALVSYITTNCDCWKGDEKTLNGFDIGKLQKLKNAIVDGKLTKMMLTGNKSSTIINNSRKVKKVTVKNAEGETQVAEGVALTDLAELFGVAIDPASDPVGYIDAIKSELEKALSKLSNTTPAPTPDTAAPVMEANEDDLTTTNPPPDPTKEKDNTVATNKNGTRKQLTEAEFMAMAPPSIQNAVRTSMKQNEQRRNSLVEMLVNHHSKDDNNKAILKPIYEKMKLEDLEALAATIPQQTNNGHNIFNPQPSYVGNQGGFFNTSNSDNGDKDVEMMGLPWDHKAAS